LLSDDGRYMCCMELTDRESRIRKMKDASDDDFSMFNYHIGCVVMADMDIDKLEKQIMKLKEEKAKSETAATKLLDKYA
jgi:hypothetical protein